MVNVIFSVLITGRYAVINVAKRVGVANCKISNGTGVGGEREHCGTDGRAEYCKFGCWDFHRIFGCCNIRKQHACQQVNWYSKGCFNSLTTNELT